MSKRLCKLNRHDITAQLSDITRLVTAPKYVCRSCARSSADKNTLCKPQALADVKKQRAMPFDAELATEIKPQPILVDAMVEPLSANKADAKRLKKQAKLQKKYVKKLRKAVDKQEKLLRKQQKIETKFVLVNHRLYQLQASPEVAQFTESLH